MEDLDIVKTQYRRIDHGDRFAMLALAEQIERNSDKEWADKGWEIKSAYMNTNTKQLEVIMGRLGL